VYSSPGPTLGRAQLYLPSRGSESHLVLRCDGDTLGSTSLRL